MFGFGSGFAASWGWRAKQRLIARVTKAHNARQYDDVERHLAPDFVYLDALFNQIDGSKALVAALQRLHEAAPDLVVVNDTMNEHEGVILVRGRIVSDDARFCCNSLWHIQIEQGRMMQLQAFRDLNAVSLPGFADLVREEAA